MERFITDNISFLEEVKEAVIMLAQEKETEAKLRLEQKRIEKLLDIEKKAVKDEIDRTIRDRQQAIISSYDKEIAVAKEKLKRLQIKREEAKNIGIKERVKEETSELLEERRVLESKLQTIPKQNSLPKYCTSFLFHSLFFPQTVIEWIVAVVFVVGILAVLPYVIYLLLPQNNQLILAGLYSGISLLFFTIYVIITSKVKIKYMQCLKEIVAIRGYIRSNKKKVKVITHAIQKDKDETNYNLGSYNYDIAKVEVDIESIAKKKQEALSKFEVVTKKVITDEIRDVNEERVGTIKEQLEEVKSHLEEVEEKVAQMSMYMASHYEGYLGKELLSKDRIDAIIHILQNENVDTITEAISIYHNQKI